MTNDDSPPWDDLDASTAPDNALHVGPDPADLVDTVDDVLPADWALDDETERAIRMTGRRSLDGELWGYTLELDGSTWTGKATVDGTEVATVSVTYAASYDPTEPRHLRTVARQLRGQIQQSSDAPSG